MKKLNKLAMIIAAAAFVPSTARANGINCSLMACRQRRRTQAHTPSHHSRSQFEHAHKHVACAESGGLLHLGRARVVVSRQEGRDLRQVGVELTSPQLPVEA